MKLVKLICLIKGCYARSTLKDLKAGWVKCERCGEMFWWDSPLLLGKGMAAVIEAEKEGRREK